VETFHKGGVESIVETLDAVAVGRKSRMPVSPVMIYGDDVTHLVTEEGVAYLYKTESLEERKAAIAAIAGATKIGLRADRSCTADLRSRGIVATSEDLGVSRIDASRKLLAAHSIEDLVAWSGGLYKPPAKFRGW
jgi:malonate decarboxylase alpha subunit